MRLTLSRAVAAVVLSALTACTGTATEVNRTYVTAASPTTSDVKVAVLPFLGPMNGSARQVALQVVPGRLGAAPISPSEIDRVVKAQGGVPNEFDGELLRRTGEALGAKVLVWGTVNRWTPYSFNRWTPATPAYVDLTLWVWRVGEAGTIQLRASKQASLPFTIWDRQPTFEDVASDAMADALRSL